MKKMEKKKGKNCITIVDLYFFTPKTSHHIVVERGIIDI